MLTLVLFAASPSTTQGYSPSVTKVRVPPATLSASSSVAASCGATGWEASALLEVESSGSAMTGMVTIENTIATAISIARNFFMRESPSKDF